MPDTTLEKMRSKLTKKFYLQIPAGLYLVSNLGWAPGKPIFEEKVVRQSDRENQWERILKCGADQRLCLIFANKKDHEKWVKQFGTKKTIHKS